MTDEQVDSRVQVALRQSHWKSQYDASLEFFAQDFCAALRKHGDRVKLSQVRRVVGLGDQD